MESKGHIDVGDIHHMMNKMGIKVNMDEASVLLVSADQDNNNVLNMNEFMDLIFSQNDALNVDLGKIAAIQASPIKMEEGTQFISDIRKDAEQLKQIRTKNQWKLFIQRNLNNISLDLLNIDKDKLY